MDGVDPGSGYCATTSIYHSILTPAELPSHPTDLTTYLFASKRVDAPLGRTIAVVDGRTGRNLTFAQLYETVRKVAIGLWQRLGIRKSDVVAIISPNSIEFGVLFLAIASLGAITTTLNPLNTNADIIRGAGAKYIFTTPELLSKAEATGLPIVLIEDETTTATKATTTLRYTDLLLTSNPLVTLSQSCVFLPQTSNPVSFFLEYLNNPKATAETLDKDGWMRTGDLVYFDVDGYLYIVDRLKELIKYKANQVAPAELESLLLTHPKVEDCAVIPFPHDAVGEIPMAYIVKKPGSALTAEEVMKFVVEQEASYKKIRKVAFIESIRKSAACKMERRKLVELSRLQAKL